jgi:outer membrane murein-binding lipoprotein Lpp
LRCMGYCGGVIMGRLSLAVSVVVLAGGVLVGCNQTGETAKVDPPASWREFQQQQQQKMNKMREEKGEKPPAADSKPADKNRTGDEKPK